MAEPPSVLYAVCLDHTPDGRKVDLGLKCWRWSRAEDNELTFWELRRFVHALFRWEQKHVAITSDKNARGQNGRICSAALGGSGTRLRREQPALPCNRGCRPVRPELAVRQMRPLQFWYSGSCCAQTKAALAILVQWVVLRHRKRAAPQRGPCSAAF